TVRGRESLLRGMDIRHALKVGRQEHHRSEPQPGCSHNGLALTKQKTFLLACTDEHGAILELDIKGKQLRRWDADDKGSKFDGGINDIVVTEAKESRLRSKVENLPGRCARSYKA
ncbi:MAG: hypothetical protein WBL40_11840, partial [Terrimicrobiaceae bacterium]